MLQKRVFTLPLKLCSRPFSLELNSEIKQIQKTCRNFAEKELRPIAGRSDEECKFPKKQIEMLGDLGMMGICVDSKYGGSELSTLALSVIVEEISRGCGSSGAIVSIHNCLYANLLNRVGNIDQNFEHQQVDGKNIGAFALSESDAGSDVVSLSTTATRKTTNSWILNGQKSWVTSLLEAKKAIVFATVDKSLKHKGITAFIVDLNAIGVQKSKSHKKMGIRATSTCDLILDNVEVSSENVVGEVGAGFKIAMYQLNQARIGIASQALGIAQASFDTAILYASQRVAFGKPILSMPQVKNRLAEMAVRIESARLLTWKAAYIFDTGDRSNKYSSFAKWQASECATYCSHNCIQILGGNGFLQDFPAERYYRDSRITEIYGGVTDVQKSIISDQLQKEYGF